MEKKINFDYKNIMAYQGFLVNEEELKKSSSGGVARAFMEAIIERKGIVFGVEYSEDFYSARYCYIENKDQINRLVGSKYIYSEKKVNYENRIITVYEAVSLFLQEGREVLFIGLGCDVAAVLSYLNNNNVDKSKLYLVDLICQGPTFPEVEESYLKRLEKKEGARVSEFSVRYKKLGWKPPYIRVCFENGKEYLESFYASDFGYAFSKYSRKGCFNCKFKGAGHKSDVTIGDFWGLEKNEEHFNKNGVSAILVKTVQGEKLVNMIDKEKFQINKADTKKILLNNPMYYMSRESDDSQSYFMDNLKSQGLHNAVKKEMGIFRYTYISLKKYVGKIVKTCLKS